MRFVLFCALLILSSLSYGATNPPAVPGEYLVKYRGSLSLKEIKATLFATSARFVSQERGLALIHSSQNMKDLRKMATVRDSRIEYVEPNFIYHTDATPNDPLYPLLWGLKNSGQTVRGAQGLVGVDISVDLAWEITTGSRNVIVAIIDTGVDLKNSDLQDNLWANVKEAQGKLGVDDDGNGYVDDVFGYDFFNNDGVPQDDNGHGSHVAGILGATGDNGSGLSGVAWKVRLMSLKFVDPEGQGTAEDAVRAIEYAVKNGAKIINASWGGLAASKAVEEAIRYANTKGVLFVTSAGNAGVDTDQTPSYPSCYEVKNIVSVAAVTNTGELAYFSNYGKKSVDLAAPGYDVYSFGLGKLEYQSGTSMAVPHVAGVAALLLSHEPNLSVTKLRERLLSSTKTLQSVRGKSLTGGLVNAYLALTDQYDPEDPVRWPTVKSNVKTPHPYENEAALTYEISAPRGTKAFSIHFSKFETEARYDVVTIYDSTGQVIWKASGNHSDEFSPTIIGEKATLTLKSDDGRQQFGFEVDRLAVRP